MNTVIQLDDNNRDANHPTIVINLLSHGDDSQLRLMVPASLQVDEFIERVLQLLGQRGNAERVEQMRKCYQPVLELLQNGPPVELDNGHTLARAGVADNATLQIAAHPLKEKLMFCRYSG